MDAPLDPRLTAMLDELDGAHRYTAYAQRAEALGSPGLARLFRALDASEIVREGLLRKHLRNLAENSFEYVVCPACGLIFHEGEPDECPVDGTRPGGFLKIE